MTNVFNQAEQRKKFWESQKTIQPKKRKNLGDEEE
tara:strand:+ start:934 stop:1038 length:105 start_codon:yes stop_codon:yes gene_type:complete